MLINDKFVVSAPYDDKEFIKAIAGSSWSKSLKAWTFKPEYKTYKTIMQQVPNIVATDEVKQWVEKYLRACENMIRVKNLKDIKLPIELGEVLYPYQRVGANYMYKFKRIINADDMGLGKTLEAICAAEMTKQDSILIVCPNSLKFTWEEEIKKWTNTPVTVIHGSSKAKKQKIINSYNGGYLIINYESFKLFPVLWECYWDVAILDEAHNIKNRNAQHTKACKKIQSNWLWLLTGTPMENRPSELWSLLNILYPDSFGSFWRFVDQFCVVDEIEDGDRTIRIPGCASFPKELHELVSPIMIRREKNEVIKELPDKLYQTILVELDDADMKVYKSIVKEMMAVVNDEVIATPTIITQYTRLKQVCISRELLSTNRENVKSAKLTALSDIVTSAIEGHKVVVFTTQLEALKLAKDNLLRRHGITSLEISGRVTDQDRQQNIKLFTNDPKYNVMLITIQAGGTGLTLTAADICIFLDKHPNPMKNLQAEDRLYRIGQKNNVNIYSIIAKGTIEEYIENMLRKKEQQFDHIIGGELTFLEKYYNTYMDRWH